MFSRKLTYKKIPLLLFLLAVVFFVMSMTGNNIDNDTQDIAKKTEKRIVKRIDILNGYIDEVLNSTPSENSSLKIPDDMVIYK